MNIKKDKVQSKLKGSEGIAGTIVTVIIMLAGVVCATIVYDGAKTLTNNATSAGNKQTSLLIQDMSYSAESGGGAGGAGSAGGGTETVDTATQSRQIAELQTKMESLQMQITNNSSTEGQSSQKISDLQSQVDSLKNKIAAGTSSSVDDKKIIDLQSQITAIKSQVTTEQNNMTIANTQISDLESQIQTLKTQVSSNKDSSASNKQAMESLQSQLEALKTQAQTNSGNISSANTQINTLQSQITSLQSKVSSLQNSVYNLQNEVSSLDEILASGGTKYFAGEFALDGNSSPYHATAVVNPVTHQVDFHISTTIEYMGFDNGNSEYAFPFNTDVLMNSIGATTLNWNPLQTQVEVEGVPYNNENGRGGMMFGLDSSGAHRAGIGRSYTADLGTIGYWYTQGNNNSVYKVGNTINIDIWGAEYGK